MCLVPLLAQRYPQIANLAAPSKQRRFATHRAFTLTRQKIRKKREKINVRALDSRSHIWVIQRQRLPARTYQLRTRKGIRRRCEAAFRKSGASIPGERAATSARDG